MKNLWVVWDEPDENGNIVRQKISVAAAIARQHDSAREIGFEYLYEKLALDDFLMVHWASLVEE